MESSFLTARIITGLPKSTRIFGKAFWKTSRICSNWPAILRVSFSPALPITVKLGERTSTHVSLRAARRHGERTKLQKARRRAEEQSHGRAIPRCSVAPFERKSSEPMGYQVLPRK
jgi:hypothetical protein